MDKKSSKLPTYNFKEFLKVVTKKKIRKKKVCPQIEIKFILLKRAGKKAQSAKRIQISKVELQENFLVFCSVRFNSRYTAKLGIPSQIE